MINIAIVGTGNISRFHSEGINKLLADSPGRAKVVALCDIYPEKCGVIAKQFGFEDAQVFDDHKKMLESGLKIDLVHICTPPSAHAEIAINCMNAGVNVLVEKPMAASSQECDAMIAAEAKNGVMMSVIAQNRFRDINFNLKKLLDSGVCGKILSVEVDSMWYRGHSYYDLWWRGTWEKEGGGPMLNHAVHQVDMLNWVRGELPVEVTAMIANVAHDNSEVEDIGFAACRYADGSVANILGSVVHHGEGQGVSIQCEKAKVASPWKCAAELPNPQGGFPQRGGNAALVEELTKQYGAYPSLKYEGHTGQIDNVYSALEGGGRPLVDGAAGKRAVELITAIYKSGFQKKAVTLPIAQDDEYYTAEGIQKNAVHFYEKGESVENREFVEITVGKY